MSKYLKLGLFTSKPIIPIENMFLLWELNSIFVGVGLKEFYLVACQKTSVLLMVLSAFPAKSTPKMDTTMRDVMPPETVL